jgi:hypothetical protein
MSNQSANPLTKKTKYLLEILLIAAFITVTFCYWNTSSVNGGITSIKDEITNIIKSSAKKEAPDPKDRSNMMSLQTKLAAYKYTRLQSKEITDIKDWTTGFMARWTKVLPDSNVTNSITEIELKFKALKAPHENLEVNQSWAIALIDLIFIVWFLLVTNSALLRDSVGDNAKLDEANMLRASLGTTTLPAKPPFSLARTQLAFWIGFIACIYVYSVLWDQHGLSTINATALLLMGISAGTAVSAGIIDSTEIADGIPRSQNEVSSGFFTDILSDSKGISLHRFQNLVWTTVAVVIYIYRYNNPESGHDNALPDLDSTLLALTGMSSATYIVLKTRENTVPDTGVIQQVKVTLLPDISLTQPQKDAFLQNGVAEAVVQLLDAGGANPLALTFVPDSKFDFIAKNVKVGIYQTATASWTGVLIPGSAALTLKGSIDRPIDNKTPNQLNVSMK